MMNINVGDKYRTLKPTEHDEYYYGYWTLPKDFTDEELTVVSNTFKFWRV